MIQDLARCTIIIISQVLQRVSQKTPNLDSSIMVSLRKIIGKPPPMQTLLSAHGEKVGKFTKGPCSLLNADTAGNSPRLIVCALIPRRP